MSHGVDPLGVAGCVEGVRLYCFGLTKAGHPRHPLYLRADAPLVPYLWGAR